MWASRRMDRRDLRSAAQRKESRFFVNDTVFRGGIRALLANGDFTLMWFPWPACHGSDLAQTSYPIDRD